jgi:hypothetical protein
VLDLMLGLFHFLLNTFNFFGNAGFQVGHARQSLELFPVPGKLRRAFSPLPPSFILKF